MNILHVSPRYWPAVGGAEKHLHEFSRRLAGEGHRVRVFTTDALDVEYFWNARKARVETERETFEGVEIRRFPIRHLHSSPLAYRGIRRGLSLLSDLGAPIPLLNTIARLAPRVPTLDRELRGTADPYDVVAAMNIAHEGLLASASELAARRGLPFALFPLTHLDERVRQFYTMRHQLALVQKAEAVFLQTRREAEFYRRAGIRPRGFVRLGPGVNPDEIRGGDATRARERFCLDGNVVLYLGTVSSDKGTLMLLEAMKQRWAEGDEKTILVFAGAVLDEVRSEFEKESRQAKNRMRVLGIVSEREKNDLLAACDMLVLPSRVDSFGIVLLEAWLYDKPVIGANAGGIPDVIEHERDGLLVPFGDVHALAQAIGRLLSDSSLAQAFGAQGRAKVLAEHTWDQKYAMLRTVYERLVQRTPLDDLAWHAS